MRQHRMTSVVAALALLLGCAPLTLVYKGLFDWMLPVTITVGMVLGASIGARALRWNTVLQVLAMFVALLLACTWQYSNGGAILGLIPGPGTFHSFGVLMGQAGQDINEQVLPVESTQALVFLLVVGVGALAVLTEIFVSVMRIPALAGIPLLLLYLIPMALLTKDMPWLLFIPGALGFLWLLMTDNIDRVRRYGRRFSGDGRGIDRWEPSPLAGTGRWLAALVVGIALLLPILVPGVNSNLLAGLATGTGSGGVTGGGTTLAPWSRLSGALDKGESQVLGYVETNQRSDTGYLKMYSLGKLTEDGFSDSVKLSSQSYPAEEGLRTDNTEQVKSENYRADVKITTLDNNALPLFSYATDVDLDREVSDDWEFDPVADTVMSDGASTRGMEYSFDYTRYEYSEEALREAPDVSQGSEEYRLNTEHPNIDSVRKLTEELTADKDNQYDKVQSIFKFFNKDNGFKYVLETDNRGTATDIENFLDYREGYCQQYAATMGWMVREAGIPARVALGLTPGRQTDKGYELNTDNFHAWVEVYFEDFGWIPFDPTPAAGVAGSQDSPWAQDPNAPDDETDEGGDEGDDENSGEEGNNEQLNPGQRPDTGGNVFRPKPIAGRLPAPVWPYWGTGAVVAGLAVLAPGLLRSLRRRRRLSVPESRPVEAAESAWREMCDSLTDLRVRFDESETARALSTRLITEYSLSGAAAAGLRHLAAAQERSRYAPEPPSGLTLRKAARAARFGVAEQQSRWAQLRADLLPASLLSAWASGLRRASSAVGNLRVRSARILGALLPRRRSAASR